VLTSLITVLVAGALTFAFAHRLWRNRAFHRDAVRATALVTGRQLHEERSVDGRWEGYHALTLRFTTMDGRTVTTGVNAYGPRAPKEGREVGIHYDPRNPQDVRLDTLLGRGTCWLVPTTLVCAVVLVIGLVALVRGLMAG
jgi:hypothetical protein